MPSEPAPLVDWAEAQGLHCTPAQVGVNPRLSFSGGGGGDQSAAGVPVFAAAEPREVNQIVCTQRWVCRDVGYVAGAMILLNDKGQVYDVAVQRFYHGWL